MRILGNRLLVAPLPPQEKSAGGIILPQAQVGDVMQFWRVEQVGPGKVDKQGVLIPPPFHVGEIVVTPLHFSHTTLEDGTNRKIVDCDQFEAKLVESTVTQLDGTFSPTVLPDI